MSDRLHETPQPCKVCPNCSAYYLGLRCGSCKWTEPCPACGGTNNIVSSLGGMKITVACTRCVNGRVLPVAVPVDDDDAADAKADTDLESPFDDDASGEQP